MVANRVERGGGSRENPATRHASFQEELAMWLVDRLIRYLADRRLRKLRREAYLAFLRLPPEIRSDIRWRDVAEPRFRGSGTRQPRLG